MQSLPSQTKHIEVPDLVSPFDGVFCARGRDASGRLEYESSDRVLKFDARPLLSFHHLPCPMYLRALFQIALPTGSQGNIKRSSRIISFIGLAVGGHVEMLAVSICEQRYAVR